MVEIQPALGALFGAVLGICALIWAIRPVSIFAVHSLSACDGFYELRDWSEGAIGLKHGEVDLSGSLVLRGAETECHATKVERVAFNGIEKCLSRRFARNSL